MYFFVAFHFLCSVCVDCCGAGSWGWDQGAGISRACLEHVIVVDAESVLGLVATRNLQRVLKKSGLDSNWMGTLNCNLYLGTKTRGQQLNI